MGRFIEGADRRQATLLPETLETNDHMTRLCKVVCHVQAHLAQADKCDLCHESLPQKLFTG